MPEISPQTRALAREVLARAKQAQADVDSATLPPVPYELARDGWAWQHSEAGTVRLSNAADGTHTRLYPPTATQGAFAEARALVRGEAALVAAGEPEEPVAPPRSIVRTLAVALIRRDGGTQARVGNHEETVEAYAEAMREGRWAWHPGSAVVVCRDVEGRHWLADGFHRVEAAQRAGLAEVLTDVRKGTRRDAVLFAAGANADHGLRRSRADVRRAIETLLRDEEWRGWSNAEIARRANTTDKTVSAVRSELETTSEIPRLTTRTGGDGKTRAAPPARPASKLARPTPPEPTPPPAAPARPVPTPEPEILDAVGRQPYGAKGAERWVPNVPHVLIIGERRHRYGPPPLIRAATIYDTPTTVRVRRPDGKEETQSQHKVWSVPHDAAWAEIEAASAAFGAALTAFADVLRELGRYDRRLAENGGIKQIPTGPLCPSVARADDPDASNQSSWWLSPWLVPHLERKSITRHTAKMLASGEIGSYVFAQYDSWLLADDAAWARVSAAQQACTDAAQAAEQLLSRLGTYDVALDDGRHQRPIDLSAQLASAGATMRAVGAAQEAAALGAGNTVGEDLDAQVLAAVAAILRGLPEPAVRVLASRLCFGDVVDVAFSAPLDEIYAGFAEVAAQGTISVMPEPYQEAAGAALLQLGPFLATRRAA
jgi:hypothetical protein